MTLVERLRRGILFTESKPDGMMTAITLEAADRIEQLETALREIAAWDNGMRADFSQSAYFAKLARRALEGK